MSKNWLVTCCFSVLLSAALLTGCGEDPAPKPPAELIDEQAFIPLYADIHQLEASIKHKLLRGHDTDAEIAAYYHHIFDAHGVTQERYEDTRAWYTQHPAVFQAMLEQVMELVATRQVEHGEDISNSEEQD